MMTKSKSYRSCWNKSLISSGDQDWLSRVGSIYVIYFMIPSYGFDWARYLDKASWIRWQSWAFATVQARGIIAKIRACCSACKILYQHTSNCNWSLGLLPPGQEDYIPLRSIDIVVLEEEDFVNSIILQSREFSKNSNRPSERPLDD